jgi:5-methylcytosine-specific restriction endonuclease McrA
MSDTVIRASTCAHGLVIKPLIIDDAEYDDAEDLRTYDRLRAIRRRLAGERWEVEGRLDYELDELLYRWEEALDKRDEAAGRLPFFAWVYDDDSVSSVELGTTDPKVYLATLRSDPCAYCGGPSHALDHITARHTGGSDDWWNFTAACHSCNTTKRARTLLSFLGARLYWPEWKAATEAMAEAKTRWNGVGQ